MLQCTLQTYPHIWLSSVKRKIFHELCSWACCLIKFNHSHDLCSCSCLLLALPHFRLPGHILSNDLPWKVYGMQHHYFLNNIMFCCNVSVCMQVCAHLFLFITGFAVSSNIPSSTQWVLPSALHYVVLMPDGLAMIAKNLTYECSACKCIQTPYCSAYKTSASPPSSQCPAVERASNRTKMQIWLLQCICIFCTLLWSAELGAGREIWLGQNKTQLSSIPVDIDEKVTCAGEGHF